MKILVLGGSGLQGRGALYELSNNNRVEEVLSVDMNPKVVESLPYINQIKVKSRKADMSNHSEMVAIMKKGYNLVIDFLPPQMCLAVTKAAVEAKVNLVNTNYGYDLKYLDIAAREAGVAILPECGFDPGIDLVLYGYALREFDKLKVLNSYCGGIPKKKTDNNLLNYKISWNFDAMLRTQKRDAVLIHEGQRVEISGQDQLDNDFVHEVNIPGLGIMEAFPNGDAIHFTNLLGVTNQIIETGRYSLRWPGWCHFWDPLKKLGFLSDKILAGLPIDITPHEFMVKLMEPQLQYDHDEKDIAAMYNVFEGIKDSKEKTLMCKVLIERDLSTGLMGMNLAVAYPACIAGEMIVTGEIDKKGLLSPVVDIPVDMFLEKLKRRGIQVEIAVKI